MIEHAIGKENKMKKTAAQIADEVLSKPKDSNSPKRMAIGAGLGGLGGLGIGGYNLSRYLGKGGEAQQIFNALKRHRIGLYGRMLETTQRLYNLQPDPILEDLIKKDRIRLADAWKSPFSKTQALKDLGVRGLSSRMLIPGLLGGAAIGAAIGAILGTPYREKK